MEAIKVGVVGIGRAGWGMHCATLNKRTDKFSIVAACDVIPERLAKMAETYEGCATYADIAELARDPKVELVSVASRSPEHVAHATLALEAGKYVFIEKPIALTLGQGEALADAARRHPGKLFCRHNRRFEPAFQHIREGKPFPITLEEAIEVVKVACQVKNGTPFAAVQ